MITGGLKTYLLAVRRWLASRVDSHAYVVTALVLNLPFLFIILWRNFDGVAPTSVTAAYAALVFLGYYGLLVFLLSTIVFLLFSFSKRLAVVTSGSVLAVFLLYLVATGVVYKVFRLHLDAFWLVYAFTNYSGLGIPTTMVLTAAGVLISIVALEVGIFWVARRVKRQKLVSATFFLAAVIALVLSQGLHIVAYSKDDSRVTSATPRLPLYFPVTSRSRAQKLGNLLPQQDGLSARDVPSSIQYPIRDFTCSVPTGRQAANVLLIVLESWRFDTMNEVVSPNIHAFGERSVVFENHFSSGNSTPHGVFGLFYGIHPTYWETIKANSSAIDNPVLIDALKANDYTFGIYADSHFERHKIKRSMFAGIEVHESFAGGTADEDDEALTERLLEFIEEQAEIDGPFMGFTFYKSTHYSYFYPEDGARFLPAQTPNFALLGRQADPAPYLNDYRNSVFHVDRLVGNILDKLEALGILDETVVMITSDHGEAFNDNEEGYWGHTSNFTKYQTQVPMIVFVPGEEPRHVTEATSHADVPATLLQEALGCGEDVRSYSNGRNLLGPQDEPRPIVVGGYVSHAFILDDNVYAAYPMFTRDYKLSDVRVRADRPRADLMRQALEETSRFYRVKAENTE